MFFKNWFRRKVKKAEDLFNFNRMETIDAMEESLWDIKEQYDLPTEEVINVVESKRKNLDRMHEMARMHQILSKKQQYE